MKDQLYIDNKVVDIDDNTNITLNYKSNLFTDVSKIVSNNTYSIKLPLTVRNCVVIDDAHIPSYMTRYPRINHKGRYLRNGVEIVSDANVTLMEITDTIDIAMAWGNVSAFANIVNGEKELQDLSYGDVEGEDYVIWRREDSPSEMFPRVEYGYSDDEKEAWYHPVVTAKWILDKISSDSGVAFDFPEDMSAYLDELIIPLLSRNDSPKMSENCIVQLKPVTLISSQDSGFFLGFEPNSITNFYLYTFGGTGSQGDNYTMGLIVNFKKIVLNLSGTVSFTMDSSYVSENMRIEVQDVNNVSLLTVYPTEVRDVGSGRSKVIFEFDNDTDETTVAGNISGEIRITLQGISLALGTSDFTGEIVITPRTSQVVLEDVEDKYRNTRYYLVPNLPDMKQIDYIKAISAICGCFAIPSSTGIKFVKIDDIISNKPKALNWSKRVVASYRENRPKSLVFSVDGFAQKNIYKWKDDEDGLYDGVIYVDDATLDEEAEVITLPFAGSETSDKTEYYGCAYIPLYSYGSDGELEYDDGVTPRLLIRTKGLDGVFTGLDWQSIINERYKVYQDVIREPKVITELIEIREYELRDLDMSVPVYLAQYGKYYAIISIKAEKTGICECELFQL